MIRLGRLWVAAALALAAAPALVAKARVPAVAVASEGLAWSGHAIRMRIDQGRPIAATALRFFVFVDDNQLETVDTRGGTSRFTLATRWPGAGRHTLKIRSGTFEATTEVRVTSTAEVATVAAVGLAIATALGVGVRRRKRRPDAPA